MRNVEGVRLIWKPEKHYALSLEQEHKIIKQAAVGVLSLRRAPKLGKLLVCIASIRSSCDLRPLRTEPPLRCAWASFYTLKGSPTGGNAEKGTNVKSEVVGTVTCIVHPT